uniref:RING-type domain-containing protein n=1 Tax=viral metagenome TaxID=1070528 RepID=A0A6C0AE49_9ZZZZ
MEDFVNLICIKEKGKLRIRITSTSYFSDANVQFPRSIRFEGRKYRVKKEHINFIQTRGKYFYSVKKESNIEILNDDFSEINVFEDTEDNLCIVCMDNEKSIVFNPCFHYYCCLVCSEKLHNCPICRFRIMSKIKKDMIG